MTTEPEAIPADVMRALRAIAEGYPARGEGDRYVIVENPDFKPDNGSDLNICIDMADRASRAPVDGAKPVATHRHKKRDSGNMQAEFWEERTDGTIDRPAHMESVDMREVAVYRSVTDGSLWVRPREEFEDGRFEPLPVRTSPEAPQASEVVRDLVEALELAANSAGFQYMTYETRVKISAVLAAYKRSTTDGNA